MAVRFLDPGATAGTDLNAANLNSLDRGGNVWQSAAGGLLVDVSACRFVKQTPSWTVVTYAGAVSQALTASQTNYVYLDTSGNLTINTSGFPAGSHVPLAEVVTDLSTVTSITDRRFMAFLP